MSVRVMTAVWDLPLADSEKIVLLALADCANDEGHCWPSMATLTKKCSKTDRTVQAAIKSLVEAGHLTRREVPGKGCNYTVHPRSECTPEAASPRSEQREPPKPLRTNRKEPSIKQTGVPRIIPVGWVPGEFGIESKSRAVVDGWPPGELATQVEHFTAHHRGKGNKFTDWQDAWSTWVLNSRRYGGRKNGTTNHSQTPDGPANPMVAAVLKRKAERAAGQQAELSGHAGGWP